MVQLTQPKGVVSKETNKEAIARIFDVKKQEVAYLTTQDNISSYSILYDENTESCWYRGSAIGVPLSWTISSGVLTLTTTTGVYSLKECPTVPDLAKTTGAGLIGTTSGKTVQQELNTRDYTTPKIEGAPCNGVNEDTSFIVTALTKYNTIKFPPGTYLLDCNKIMLKSNQRIELSIGANVTVINTSGTSGAGYAAKVFTIVGDSSTTVKNVEVFGGTFTYTDDTISVVGVGSYVDGVKIKDIRAVGCRIIDVSDSASPSYASSVAATRPRNVHIERCRGSMVTLTSKGACINFRLVEDCSTYGNNIQGYQYGIQWSGGDAATYTDLSNERKCKRLRMDKDVVTARYAGIWGSMGEDIKVQTANVKSTTTTASDVGIDFEGCINSGAFNCYVEGFTQGNLATYFINSGITFSECISVAPAGCRAARINNSLQIPTNTNIKFVDCHFKGDGAGSKVAQAGAVDNLRVINCTFEDVYLAMASNNNGSMYVHGNQFRFSMVPSDMADAANNMYAAILLSYANNNERLISIRDNSIYSSVSWTGLTTNTAICVISNNFNAYTRVEISGGGTYSTTWSSDIMLLNGSGNSGITIAYTIDNFVFGNKGLVTGITGSATLYPLGTFYGRTNGGVGFPASITDNVNYASCYYNRGQRFESNTPTAGSALTNVVTVAGLGTAATVAPLTLN